MTDAWRIIACHINETLPDSLVKRKQLLEALSWAMPEQHITRDNINAHIAALELSENLQRDLPLKFKEAAR